MPIRKPRVLDVVFGCLAIPIPVINWMVVAERGTWPYVLDAVIITGLTAALFFRQSMIRQAFVVTFGLLAAMAVLHLLAPINLGVSPLLLAAPLSVVAVTRYDRDRRWGLAALILGLLGSLATPVAQFAIDRALAVVTCMAVILVAFLFGMRQRDVHDHHRREIEQLAEQNRLLEVERDQRIALARGDERARIARELHDIVAHSLTVIQVQASTGLALADQQPGRAREALSTIVGQSRQSLGEMRYLVGVLRTGDEEAGPQPDLRRLPALVDQGVSTGGEITMQMPDDRELQHYAENYPAPIQLAIYRIVQEALTNILKHAGNNPRGSVSIELSAAAATISITNSVSQTAIDQIWDDTMINSGNGLVGLAERVETLGGQCVTGPSGDGFAVEATIPVKELR